jgi:hypothetical protein
LEGVEVLGLIERCQGQIRTAGLGQIIGLDYGAVLKMAELLGLNMIATAALLPFAEAGFLEGMKQLQEQDRSVSHGDA